MPKISAAQKQTRRQQILDAALRCFSRDGFHNTTTADIVRESGVSQGTLYLYFKTKDDIIVALADDRHQGEAFLGAMAQSEQDPIKGLSLLLELHGSSLENPERTDARRVGIQGWAEALRNPTIHAKITEGTSLVRGEIIRLIERGQRTGQIRPGRPTRASSPWAANGIGSLTPMWRLTIVNSRTSGPPWKRRRRSRLVTWVKQSVV